LCGAWIEQALLLFGDFKEAWGDLIKIINGKNWRNLRFMNFLST